MASEKEVLHFRCFFDLYTPRPHIIIKVNERLQEKAKKEDVRLLSASALSALLSFARCAQKQYSFTAARLSFHCGSFQSDPYFHAHLCVDTEEYLAAYRLINLSEQATRRHVTRQWKRGKETPSSSDYAKCVRTYADHQAVKAQVAIVLEPRIGFKPLAKVASPDRSILLAALAEFAYGTLILNETDGCHICLAWDGALSSDPYFSHLGIVGYIQAPPWRFYQFNPRRALWWPLVQKYGISPLLT